MSTMAPTTAISRLACAREARSSSRVRTRGPGTAPVSRDGEYEWTRTIRPEHLPMVPGGLGVSVCADVVEVLAARFTGAGF